MLVFSLDSSVAVEAVSGRGPRTESTSSQDSTGMLPSVPSFAQVSVIISCRTLEQDGWRV
jgi:hypothetical protein